VIVSLLEISCTSFLDLEKGLQGGLRCFAGVLSPSGGKTVLHGPATRNQFYSMGLDWEAISSAKF
jgi:hypothetical protein